ncbi:integrase catalytic subunit [Burkholderia lata]|uniref:Integrase catalytic subunit n=1 Tax=Burkholderia lata (strain ATCC 17760 / DSM 23089 / LMG 22485 / NCIMB 9086 / R18194 / 383) TaxID=482957 RepID=A0A6P2KY54_BURL3|nr:integrase catalytic subunit [Burkholderia lata]
MGQPGLITMSMRELDRLRAVEAVIEQRLMSWRAAEQLWTSRRQPERLAARYRAASRQRVPSSGLTIRRGSDSSRRMTAAQTCLRTSPRFSEVASNRFRRARRSASMPIGAPRGSRPPASSRCKFSLQRIRPVRTTIRPTPDRVKSGAGRRTDTTPGLSQRSRKGLSLSARLGCINLRIALLSICRIRSRVTSNCLPTSSSV